MNVTYLMRSFATLKPVSLFNYFKPFVRANVNLFLPVRQASSSKSQAGRSTVKILPKKNSFVLIGKFRFYCSLTSRGPSCLNEAISFLESCLINKEQKLNIEDKKGWLIVQRACSDCNFKDSDGQKFLDLLKQLVFFEKAYLEKILEYLSLNKNLPLQNHLCKDFSSSLVFGIAVSGEMNSLKQKLLWILYFSQGNEKLFHYSMRELKAREIQELVRACEPYAKAQLLNLVMNNF